MKKWRSSSKLRQLRGSKLQSLCLAWLYAHLLLAPYNVGGVWRQDCKLAWGNLPGLSIPGETNKGCVRSRGRGRRGQKEGKVSGVGRYTWRR